MNPAEHEARKDAGRTGQIVGSDIDITEHHLIAATAGEAIHITLLKRSREGFTVAYCLDCRWTCSGALEGIERSRRRHEDRAATAGEDDGGGIGAWFSDGERPVLPALWGEVDV